MKLERITDELYRWSDACNVYVLKDGDAALLIDLGDGSVLDALPQIGVKNVEWVLFTHHHREQCQGAPRLADSATKFAAPEAERALFEQPHTFRKMKVTLGDAHSVYGASYSRPPLVPIKIEKGFKKMDTFTWHDHEIRCLSTPGNSPGSMSYLLKLDDRWIAFSGDVMLDGAKMHTYFDSEWDYGFGKGLYALHNSASLLECFDCRLLCPSHGPMIEEPDEQLRTYMTKLRQFMPLYLRGYDVFTFAEGDQDNVSKPTEVPHLWHISPHLYKFKGPDFWPNFSILIADSGHALVFDCGVAHDMLDDTIRLMQERLGLKQIDAVIISHMHGDHCVDAGYLREKWGAKVWTLDRVAEKIEHPEWFDYAAPIQSYRPDVQSLKCDGVFTSGQKIEWEDYTFTIDWMPGQTEFHCAVHGEIDGKLMVFTGDNVFGSTVKPTNNGHECVMARNSGILEEGYIYAGEYLKRLKPDLIVGAHGWIMPEPTGFIDRYLQTSIKLRDAFKTFSTEDDYRLMFDPYWVRAQPYRQQGKPGDSVEVVVHVRNFGTAEGRFKILVQTPPGITAMPKVVELEVPPESSEQVVLKLDLANDLAQQIHLVAFDVTLDGKHFGPWFDMIVEATASAVAVLPASAKT